MTNVENTEKSDIYRFDPYTLDPEKRELMGPRGLVSIERRVFDLLLFLIRNRERAVTKEEIQEGVWPNTVVTETALTRAVMKARRAVGDSAVSQDLIRTLHGQGYRFVADVTIDQASTPVTPPTEAAAEPAPQAPDPEPEPPPPTLATSTGRLPSTLIPIVAGVVIALLIAAHTINMLEEDVEREPPSPVPVQQPATMAVMPFENLSPDPEHSYFAEGIHGEILNQISRGTDIKVLARASVRRYADTDVPPQQVASELGVEHILTGSIRYADDRVRVTTQLIDGVSGVNLWSENYDREFKDIFTIQSDVAAKIAAALHARADVPVAGHAHSTEAYREYLLARSYRARTFETGWEPVLEHTRRALALDADFVPALWILHNAYQNRIIGEDHNDAHSRMREVTARAVDAEPNHALTLALVAKDAAYEWRWQDSIDAWDKALIADKDNPTTHGNAAWVYLVTGDIDAASNIVNKAISENPGHDWPHYVNFAIQRAAGDTEAALASADLIISIGSNRTFPTAFTLAADAAVTGDIDAVEKYGDIMVRFTGGQMQPVKDLLLQIARGDDIDLDGVRSFAAANPPTNNYKWMGIQLYLAMGATDDARSLLADISSSRALYSVFKMTTDPVFGPLWQTEEYARFLEKVQLATR